MAIPKTIHYCWFGHNPKPKLALKCMKSWKKYCPDYEIIEWNEENFDISACPLYVRQAYEAEKWAFVTDYIRLKALYEHGGIYLDTDVELTKPLDSFLHHEAFTGFEDGYSICTSLIACRKEFPMIKEFMRHYEDTTFLHADGTMNLMPNVKTMTDLCLKYGLVQNDQYQMLERLAIYPQIVFSPVDYYTGKVKHSKDTAAIHWYSASWQSEEMRRRHKRQMAELNRKELFHYIAHIPNRALKSILGDLAYEKLKKILK